MQDDDVGEFAGHDDVGESALFQGLDYMSLDAAIVKTRGGKRVYAYSSMYLDPLLRVYV